MEKLRDGTPCCAWFEWYHASPAPHPQLSLAGIGADKGQLSSVFSPSTETEKGLSQVSSYLSLFSISLGMAQSYHNKKHKGWKCGSLVHISLLAPRLNGPEIIWFSPFLPASFVWMYIYMELTVISSPTNYILFIQYTVGTPSKGDLHTPLSTPL